MPSRRRKAKSRRSKWPPFHLLDDALIQLKLEHAMQPASGEYWEENGEAYLRDHWIPENPGTRPHWWWALYGPEDPVRVLGPIEDAGPFEPIERRESQAAYLHRHELLTGPELELWNAGKLPTEEATWPARMAFNRVIPGVGKVVVHGLIPPVEDQEADRGRKK